MKKHIRNAAAGAVAVILAAANCLPVSAAGKSTVTADDIVKTIHDMDIAAVKAMKDDENIPNSDDRMPVVDVSGLPSKFDLRNVDGVNYVSPIKDQSPWGTCWSFGATAAAETSIASELGHDYNGVPDSDADAFFDLSEKHLAWFTYSAIPEGSEKYASQTGEGYHVDYDQTADKDLISESIYNNGGFMNFATAVYSSGMGPTLEAFVPYGKTTDKEYIAKRVVSYVINEDGEIDEDELKVNYYYDDAKTDEEIRALWEEKGYEEVDADIAVDIYNGFYQGITVLPDYKDGAVKKFGLSDAYSNGDWTLDDTDRFLSIYYLQDGNMLPSPALTGKDGEYVFNRTGVDAIKSELVNGRGVSVCYNADQSSPGQSTDNTAESFMNFIDKNGNPTSDQLAEYWAQYTYDKDYDPTDKDSVNRHVEINHAVCIIGYDDDFPKEYFKDPKGTLAGNGAFLVKNSWGAVNYNENGELESTWGNGGDGTFWLLYYDQSILIPESFNFDIDNTLQARNIDMYDFLPTNGKHTASFDGDVYMANVFTAQNNCTVRYIGLETAEADVDVEYRVYLLNENAKSPVDGECITEQTGHLNYAGYHVIDLGKTWYLGGGDKYSVVVKSGAEGKSSIYFSQETRESDFDDEMRNRAFDVYPESVVNPGESFVGTSLTDNGAWTDWSDIVTELSVSSRGLCEHGIQYDNLPIRSYPQTEAFTVFHLHDAYDKSVLVPGDKIRGTVLIQNNSGVDFLDEDDLELAVTIGQNVTDYPIGRITDLKAGEAKEFNYSYTVTEADAAAGKVVGTVNVVFNGEVIDYGALFDETITYTIDVDTAPAPEQEPKQDKNPATGNELYAVVLLAGAAAAAAASRKRR